MTTTSVVVSEGRFILHHLMASGSTERSAYELWYASDNQFPGVDIALRLYREPLELEREFRKRGFAELGDGVARAPSFMPYLDHGRGIVGDLEGEWFFVTRQFGARTLADAERERSFSPLERLSALQALARALVELHTSGLYHGCVELSRVVQLGVDGAWLLADMEAGSAPVGRGEEADILGFGRSLARLLNVQRTNDVYVCRSSLRRALGSTLASRLEEIAVLCTSRSGAMTAADIESALALHGELGSESRRATQPLLRADYSISEAAVSCLHHRMASSPKDPLSFRDVAHHLGRVLDFEDDDPPVARGLRKRSRNELEQLLSLGIDDQWLEMLGDHRWLLARRRKQLGRAGIELPAADWYAAEFTRAHEARHSLLRWESRDAEDVVAEMGLSDVTSAYLLCRLGVLVGVVDHGRLLLPTFQFGSTMAGHPVIFVVNTMFNHESPSWSALAWWTEPLDGRVSNRSRPVPARLLERGDGTALIDWTADNLGWSQ